MFDSEQCFEKLKSKLVIEDLLKEFLCCQQLF